MTDLFASAEAKARYERNIPSKNKVISYTPGGAGGIDRTRRTYQVTGDGQITIETKEGEIVQSTTAKSLVTGDKVLITKRSIKKTPLTQSQNLAPSSKPSSLNMVGLYDTRRKQTREVTGIEADLAKDINKRTGISYSSTDHVEDSREKILTDPKTRYVYFTSSNNEFKPLAVFVEEPAPVKKNYSMINIDTNQPKRGFFSGLYKEFKAGYGLKPSPSLSFDSMGAFESSLTGRSKSGEMFSPSVAGARRVAYVSGVVTNTAALSYNNWENAGQRVGSYIYSNPKLYQAAGVVSNFLKTKPLKVVQSGLLTLYGGTKAYEGYEGYKEEGLIGVSRTGLDVTKTTAAFSGMSKGIKLGIQKGIENTRYKITIDKSRTKTDILGNDFESKQGSKGIIKEMLGDKVRRTFKFRDVTEVKGKTTTLLKINAPEGGKQSTFNLLIGESKSGTNIYLDKGRFNLVDTIKTSKTFKAAQATTTKPMIEANIFGKEINIGVGRSKAAYLEGSDISKSKLVKGHGNIKTAEVTGGTGFTYSQSGQVTDYSGKIMTKSKLFDTKTLKFYERVTEINPGTKETINLGKNSLITESANKVTTSGLNLKTLTEKLSNNLGRIGTLKKNVEVSILPITTTPEKKAIVESPTVVTSTNKYNTKPRLIGYGITPQQELMITPSIKDKQKDSIKSDVGSVINFDIRPKEMTILSLSSSSASSNRPKTRPISTTLQENNLLKTADIAVVSVTTTQDQDQKRREKPITAYQFKDTIPSGGKGGGFGFGNINIPELNPPGFDYNIPIFGNDKKKSKKKDNGFLSFGGEYSASVEAELFDIRGKKPKNYTSGLVLRPLQGGFKL